MEWLLSLLLSCLPWHECPSSFTLKGTLLDRREWDILATDPRVGVKGNRGADERERNYGQKTKRNLVSKQLFWWEGGAQLRSRHFPWQVMSLSLPRSHHAKLRTSSHWQRFSSYLMGIGWGLRAQEVTAWFPQSHPWEKLDGVNIHLQGVDGIHVSTYLSFSINARTTFFTVFMRSSFSALYFALYIPF